MSSVTKVIKTVKQPKGGYLNPKFFTRLIFNDGNMLDIDENINPSLIGLSVDYLTRLMNGCSAEEAFKISLLGSSVVDERDYAKELLKKIRCLDNNSIINACQLVGYDVAYRAGASTFISVRDIRPNEKTISNISIMVNRALTFIEKYGPIVMEGFTFTGGYTEKIKSGDGDFLTNDCLWDMKVLKKEPTNKQTLQLLIYYIMGMHSIHDEFSQIEKIGIFNPRINAIYTYNIQDIPQCTFTAIENDIIGY